jgi:hypothetical protein
VAARRPSLGTYCTCFLDSSMVLHWVFDEPEVSRKLAVFEKYVTNHQLPVEILPQVNLEVTRRIMVASNRLVEILRDITQTIELAGSKVSALKLDSQALILIERAADKVIGGLRIKFAQDDRKFDSSKRQVKIVEATIVAQLQEELETGKSSTVAELIATAENELGESYVRYSDRLADMNHRLKTTYVDGKTVPKVKPQVRAALSAIVNNPGDVQMLCEGTGRMFKTNRCCALISLDYNDLVKKRPQIEKETLLLVCDPLYATAHLETRISVSRTLEEEVRRRQQVSADFIETPSPAAPTATPAVV